MVSLRIYYIIDIDTFNNRKVSMANARPISYPGKNVKDGDVVTEINAFKDMHICKFSIDGKNRCYITHELRRLIDGAYVIGNVQLYGPIKDIDSKYLYIDSRSMLRIADKNSKAEILLAMQEKEFATLILTVSEFIQFFRNKNVSRITDINAPIPEPIEISETDIAIGDSFVVRFIDENEKEVFYAVIIGSDDLL